MTSEGSGTATITATTAAVDGTAGIEVGLLASAAGGTVSSSDGEVTLVIPEGALSESIRVTAGASSSSPANVRLVPGTDFDLGPDGTTFDQPVVLTIGYDPADLPAGVAESDLRLFKVVDGTWKPVAGSTVDTEANTVTAQITSFSVFGALAMLSPATVVINEVENRVESSRHSGDYVELFAVEAGSLEGYRVVMTAIDGQQYGETALEGEVEAGQFILIAASDVESGDYGFVGLQDGPGAVQILRSGPEAGGPSRAGSAAQDVVVDAVEWGDAGLGRGEGAPAPVLPLPAVVQRRTDGQDSDDNQQDFCLNTEDLATPGGPNEECILAEAWLSVVFLSRDGIIVPDLFLKKGQVVVFNAWVDNLSPPATAAATQLVVSPLTSSNPAAVLATDLAPFPTNILGPGQGDKHLVGVMCLVDNGFAVVNKTATSPDDVTGFGLDLLDVACIPDFPPPPPPPFPPPPPPPLPEPDSQMEVTITDPSGTNEQPDKTMFVGEVVETAVKVANVGQGYLLLVERPSIDPAGMGLERSGTWPNVVNLPKGEDRLETSVFFECLEVGVFEPSASSKAANHAGDDDSFTVTCQVPAPNNDSYNATGNISVEVLGLGQIGVLS